MRLHARFLRITGTRLFPVDRNLGLKRQIAHQLHVLAFEALQTAHTFPRVRFLKDLDILRAQVLAHIAAPAPRRDFQFQDADLIEKSPEKAERAYVPAKRALGQNE